MAIRITMKAKNKTIQAKDGKDAAEIVKNELDRQWHQLHVQKAA